LPSLEAKTSTFHKSVYSVEVKSNSRSLEIPVYEENKVFNLTSATTGMREIKLAAAPPPQKPIVKASTSKATSAVPAVAGTKKEPEEKKPAKNAISAMFAKKEASPKKEVAKKTSPEVVENGQKAKAKPAAKNSIAAFLSGKATTSKTAAPKPEPKAAAHVEPEKPVKVEKTVDEQSRKRTICDGLFCDTSFEILKLTMYFSDESSGDDVIPATPVAKKSPAKKSKPNHSKSKGRPTKRSRIMAVESSSESEDEETKEERRVSKARGAVAPDSPVKKIKKAIESDDDNVQVISGGESDKKNGVDDVENQPSVRNKAKRMVVKTYKDEDGFFGESKAAWRSLFLKLMEIPAFLVTRKELEEYSAGEEEAPPVKEVLKPAEKIEVVNASKKKTKQGSIMNFFTKKN
jgi:DNA polymerase subunit Cdc27